MNLRERSNKTDAEKIAHYDAMVTQNRKHIIWYAELQEELERYKRALSVAYGWLPSQGTDEVDAILGRDKDK